MKPYSFFSRLSILIVLLAGSVSCYGKIEADSIKPLTQVNKQFLIVAHIVMSKDSSANVTEAAITSQIAAVNALFVPIGVSFKVCEFRYIYNYNYDDLNLIRFYQNELMAKYNVNNRINMYFVKNLDNGPIKVCGLGTLTGIGVTTQSKAVWIVKDCVNSLTIGHELGHYFSLSHPFDNPGEFVDGSNCASAGDNVCDTPADPYIPGRKVEDYITADCVFNYNATDAHGDFYDPDVSNIMSYYTPCVCLKFTHDQYEKMAQYYLSHPISW